MENTFFCERQEIPRGWLWLVFGAPAFYLVYQLIFNFHFFTFFPLLIILLLAFFFSSLKLKTIINQEGIRIKLTPFQSENEVYPWEAVETAHIRTYKPIPEFGGWGLCSGKSGRAITLYGTCGLHIHFKSGKTLLIGTFRPAEMERILKRIMAE